LENPYSLKMEAMEGDDDDGSSRSESRRKKKWKQSPLIGLVQITDNIGSHKRKINKTLLKVL